MVAETEFIQIIIGEVNSSVQKNSSDNDNSDDVNVSEMDQKVSKISDVVDIGK